MAPLAEQLLNSCVSVSGSSGMRVSRYFHIPLIPTSITCATPPATSRQHRHFDETHPTRSQIGERRHPTPTGLTTCGSIPITNGDLDAIKGVYHINAVDELTQFQCVFSVERIGDALPDSTAEGDHRYLSLAIKDIHADNSLSDQSAGYTKRACALRTSVRYGRLLKETRKALR